MRCSSGLPGGGPPRPRRWPAVRRTMRQLIVVGSIGDARARRTGLVVSRLFGVFPLRVARTSAGVSAVLQRPLGVARPRSMRDGSDGPFDGRLAPIRVSRPSIRRSSWLRAVGPLLAPRHTLPAIRPAAPRCCSLRSRSSGRRPGFVRLAFERRNLRFLSAAITIPVAISIATAAVRDRRSLRLDRLQRSASRPATAGFGSSFRQSSGCASASRGRPGGEAQRRRRLCERSGRLRAYVLPEAAAGRRLQVCRRHAAPSCSWATSSSTVDTILSYSSVSSKKSET